MPGQRWQEGATRSCECQSKPEFRQAPKPVRSAPGSRCRAEQLFWLPPHPDGAGSRASATIPTALGRAVERRTNIPMLKQLFALSALACLSASPLVAQGTQRPPSMEEVTANERLDRTVNQNLKEPLTQEEVRNLIKKNKKDLDVVYRALDERGVNFDLDRKIEVKMRMPAPTTICCRPSGRPGQPARIRRRQRSPVPAARPSMQHTKRPWATRPWKRN